MPGLYASMLAWPALAAAAPLAPPPASTTPASTTPGQAAPATAGPPIVVVGSRLKIPGSVDAPQLPIAVMDEEDIAAYGATSVTDLLADIAPETGSGRGRGSGGPVILVNGQRIASFRELRDYPPEAIRRVEILPEEVALRYGYPPDQRVVNFILKDNFHSRIGELEVTRPDRGGTTTEQGHFGLLRINRNQRINVTLKASHTSALTDAARNVTQVGGTVSAEPGDPDPADFRTLVPGGSNYSANATWTIGLGHGRQSGSLALNATASRADATNLNGLNSVDLTAPGMPKPVLRTLPGALAQMTRTDTLNAGTSLNKPLGDWQLSATLDSSHAVTTTRTDQRATAFLASLMAQAAEGSLDGTGPLPPPPTAAISRAQSIADGVTSLITVVGHPLSLPAGPINLTLRAGFADTAQTSSVGLIGHAGSTRLRRGDASAGANLALPVTSRRKGVLGAIGDITLNFSAGLDHLSDFGELTDWSAGATWNLTEKLGLQASYIVNQTAPSLSDLGNPDIAGFNSPVYDFRTNQTVLVTTLSGGNPGLKREGEHDIKLGMNWQLPFIARGNLIVEYFANRSSNVASSFPIITAAVEAAYPGRIMRNGTSQITTILEMPVNLAVQHEQRLRWGFNLAGNLGKPLPIMHRRGSGAFGGGWAAGGFGAGGFGGGGGDPRRSGFDNSGAAPGQAAAGGIAGRPPAGDIAGRPRAGDGTRHDDGPPDGSATGAPEGRGATAPRQGYSGRWNISIYHTMQLVDRVLLAPGAPMLDLLDGDAVANSGGVPRHSVEIEAGGFFKGFGLRSGGTWTAPTQVNSSGVPGASQLRFGAVFKVNLRAFVDLGAQQRLVKASAFFQGARLSLMANNLFDSRQKVTDATGATPLSYQPDFLDPLGRVLGVEFRELF